MRRDALQQPDRLRGVGAATRPRRRPGSCASPTRTPRMGRVYLYQWNANSHDAGVGLRADRPVRRDAPGVRRARPRDGPRPGARRRRPADPARAAAATSSPRPRTRSQPPPDNGTPMPRHRRRRRRPCPRRRHRRPARCRSARPVARRLVAHVEDQREAHRAATARPEQRAHGSGRSHSRRSSASGLSIPPTQAREVALGVGDERPLVAVPVVVARDADVHRAQAQRRRRCRTSAARPSGSSSRVAPAQRVEVDLRRLGRPEAVTEQHVAAGTGQRRRAARARRGGRPARG